MLFSDVSLSLLFGGNINHLGTARSKESEVGLILRSRKKLVVE